MCEKIFGPEKDWECSCGKYRGMKYKGMICDRCGVKVTHSRVRRKRMGHIELAAPSCTSGSSRRCPAGLGALLDMKTSSLGEGDLLSGLRRPRYQATPLKKQQLAHRERSIAAAREPRTATGGSSKPSTGAEAVRKLLSRPRPRARFPRTCRTRAGRRPSSRSRRSRGPRSIGRRSSETDPRHRQQALSGWCST